MSDKEQGGVFHVVALEYPGEHRAKQIVDLVKKQQKDAGFEVKAWVVVEVNEKGKAKVVQTGHGGMGATLGGATGAALGLIGGPAGLLVWLLGGALLGGVAGKHLGRDFDPSTVKAVAAGMEPNSSALLLIVEDKFIQEIGEELGSDAEMFTFTMGSQISGELAQVAAVQLGEPGAAEEEG